MNANRRYRIVVLALAVVLGAVQRPLFAEDPVEIAVIAHPDMPLRELTPDQISDLYLGRRRLLAEHQAAYLLDLPRDSKLRERFFNLLNGMSLNQVNTYWARLMFTGHVSPPESQPDTEAVLQRVRSNLDAIGYIDARSLDQSVKVVCRLRP